MYTTIIKSTIRLKSNKNIIAEEYICYVYFLGAEEQ